VPDTFVIAGASLAGATAATVLRREGFDGRIVMIGAEERLPYERPPLSKRYLRGEEAAEDFLVRPPEWYQENEIELRLGTIVAEVDPAARELVLGGGERVGYDRLLIATGARNRRLSAPGGELDGVIDLRRLEDSDRIREAAAKGGPAVLIGMGFIGAEVAASLRALGVDVTVIEPFETAMYRALGAEFGRVLEAIHRDHGVEMVFGDALERFEGSSAVERVVTREGRAFDAAFVVAGVGVQPNAELWPGELAPDGGIPVDATLSTEVPGVFAAGDVASHDHPVFGRIRVEHFDNAIKMGEAAARTMLGVGEAFDDAHWFWSDQYDTQVQMAGWAPTYERTVVRGSVEDRSFCAFLLDGAGVVRGAISVDWKRDVRRSFELIRRGVAPDERALADPEVDVRTLVPGEG
jgi:3-phenylpropionate/trans-cinnamate dioxygenase ferredoxin reductase subunit